MKKLYILMFLTIIGSYIYGQNKNDNIKTVLLIFDIQNFYFPIDD